MKHSKLKNYYGLAGLKELKKDKRQKLWRTQIKNQGFDSTELWSLDVTIAKFLLPRLIAFKKNYNETVLDENKFNKKLKKMILACKLKIKDMDGAQLSDKENRQMIKGFKLLGKYIHALWT
mgnify:CR=1 FL=1|jgi:hypothetical protein